jgi:hypothetical protein
MNKLEKGLELKETELQLMEVEIDQGQELETDQRLENIENGQNRLNNPRYRAYIMSTPFYKGLVDYLAK